LGLTCTAVRLCIYQKYRYAYTGTCPPAWVGATHQDTGSRRHQIDAAPVCLNKLSEKFRLKKLKLDYPELLERLKSAQADNKTPEPAGAVEEEAGGKKTKTAQLYLRCGFKTTDMQEIQERQAPLYYFFITILLSFPSFLDVITSVVNHEGTFLPDPYSAAFSFRIFI
jgi:hypothetical protein